MATDLQPRKPAPRAATYLQRKFAGLCVRIRRIDVIAHLIVLSLIVLGYAFAMGLFDSWAGSSTATTVVAARWLARGVFAILFLMALVQTIRACFRSVNPYYVARQLEQSLPDAKNSLINWLDLHDDDLPLAFQKNLSTRAEEQMKAADAEQALRARTNWWLAGLLALPAFGLLVLVILDPALLAGSLQRAFVPFAAPEVGPRTVINMMDPPNGDGEVRPGQPIPFAAKIEGRFPIGNHPDAPRLHYRYQSGEDFRSIPLQLRDGAAWAVLFTASDVRTGFTYKISAGDAETPEHQIRVRAPAHIVKYEITYRHRPYRRMKDATEVFPNPNAAEPMVHGPPGTEVELLVRADRPLSKASVEVSDSAPMTRLLPEDANAFITTWTLEKSGQFRVRFTAADGEDNTDSAWFPILVSADDAPKVVLIEPGKNVSVAENGNLEVAGLAASEVGIKALTLHLRAVNGTEILLPIPYRPGHSFRLDDGSYPKMLAYREVILLDQFKNQRGTLQLMPRGRVIEYWLEATDSADAPNAQGNVGKSDTYTITLTNRLDAKTQQSLRQDALQKQKNHQQKQDQDQARQNQQAKSAGNGGSPDPRKELEAANQQKKDVESKIDQALKNKDRQEKHGKGKSANPESGQNKDGSQPDRAQEKNQPPMSPDDAGKKKDEGDKGGAGQAKDNGAKQKPAPKSDAAKGERKDGPGKADSAAKGPGAKNEPAPSGGAKSADTKGAGAPMPGQPKDQNADAGAPTPIAKNGGKNQPPPDGPPQGHAKGAEQNGPDTANQPQKVAKTPPAAVSKDCKTPEAAGKNGTPNPNTAGENRAGSARGDNAKADQQPPSLGDVAKAIDQLPRRDDQGDAAGAALAALARNAADPELRDLAKDALRKNGRDPGTGKDLKKGKNPFGSGKGSAGVSDDVKAAAANREFTAKLGQMQLADWKKRMTPDVLKKAGLSAADWQRYLKTMQSYDSLVRQLNAKLSRDEQTKILRATASVNRGPGLIESTNPNRDPSGGGAGVIPPDLIDAARRFPKAP